MNGIFGIWQFTINEDPKLTLQLYILLGGFFLLILRCVNFEVFFIVFLSNEYFSFFGEIVGWKKFNKLRLLLFQ